MRFLGSVILLVVVSVSALAQKPVPVRKLTVTPAAEPRPALSIELLPRYKDRLSEDATVAYFRAFLDRHNHPDPVKAAEQSEQLQKWLDTPPSQLPLKEVQTRVDSYRHVYKELDRASRCEQCNWGTLPRLREDGIATLLQEAQPAREVARLLALRCKLEIAEKRFLDAEKSLRIGFQMAKHVGESPTLIQLLVGLAIEAMFLERVEEWIATPGSPNLYSALTAMPRPLINPKPAFAGEELFVDTLIPNLDRLRSGPLPHDEAARLVEGVLQNFGSLGNELQMVKPYGGENPIIVRFGLAGYVLWMYPSAKAELIARGRSKEDVEKMAGAQVVFLSAIERFLTVRDNQWKWLGLPYFQSYPKIKSLNTEVKRLTEENRTDVFFAVFSLIIPASEKVIEAIARTERRVAALRTIEAIRMYAVKSGGVPPKSLDAAELVPIPDDPFTGKPFEYSTNGHSFNLAGPPLAGDPPTQNNSLRYEIMIAEPK